MTEKEQTYYSIIRYYQNFVIIGIFVIVVTSLLRNCLKSTDHLIHDEKNSVYYWKTVLDLNSNDYKFIRQHKIGRIYLRMFDVSIDTEDKAVHAHTIPIGTMRVTDKTFYELKESLPSMEYVPVVYITNEAMKDGQTYGIGNLAKNIVWRVKNMCLYNNFTNIGGLQLDCDWTKTTEKAFFNLCDSIKSYLKTFGLQWQLSSTIRLHQLRQQVPPVDYGVLMVYNTGKFNDPDGENSILCEKDVKLYLKYLRNYPLHLDVAYPTYSWQLLFRNRRFSGLLNGVNVTDPEKFSAKTANTYIAKSDITYKKITIRKGNMIRAEQSDYQTIVRVKKLVERNLKNKSHSNILYHFELRNLLKYSDNEIENLFNIVSDK